MMAPKTPVRDTETLALFPELPTPEQVEVVLLRNLRHPIWSEHKARLIEKYLYFFVMVTKHGTYIDGFSGPQEPEKPETWSAKRVIESKPRFLRNFFLCELDPVKVEALKALVNEQPPKGKKESKRACSVIHGDFNERVDEVLSSGVITDKEATFALLDQRTFECKWGTVEKLARHKTSGNKIELFYFLAVKWIHRSMAGMLTNEHRIADWWGRDDWPVLKGATQQQICDLVRTRFINELGYRHAIPFPIWEREGGEGSIMYYMIHATDHPAAPGLMWRAYDQAIHPIQQAEQTAFAEF